MGLPITGQVRQQITSDRHRLYFDSELQRDRACVLHRLVAQPNFSTSTELQQDSSYSSFQLYTLLRSFDWPSTWVS
jgi:hypothetical protein